MTTPLCCSWRATVAATLIAMSVGCAPRAAPDRFFTIGDVRLRYREIGRGEPVVLLHGATRSLEDWAGFGDSLAVDHRVIALDLRGHGQSSKFTERARFGAAIVDDVVRLIDHLHLQRAHVVGHSLGAVVAANVTARYPARVATVSLIAPPLYADSAAYMEVYGAGIADLERGAGMARFNQVVYRGRRTRSQQRGAWRSWRRTRRRRSPRCSPP
jgi:pimeloyl-ACP methyl ester carboxylesterase